MKLKEVCNLTGLTQKTVRFYEEKQLISPASVIKNGRSYREYSNNDVKALLEIATLRKAYFSLEEIYLMQQDPDEIVGILESYRDRITKMASTMASLSAAANNLPKNSISDISDLAQAMSAAANPLPLPSYDLKPNFKQLDQLETEEHIRIQQDQRRRRGESPFILEQQKFTNRLGLFNEHYTHNTALSGGSANYPKPEEPRILRYVNLFLSGLILILTLTIVYFIMSHSVELVTLWSRLRSWLLPVDLGLLAVRLMTAPLYNGFVSRNKRPIIINIALLLFILAVISIGSILIFSPSAPKSEPDLTLVLAVQESISAETESELTLLLQSLIYDCSGNNQAIARIHTVDMSKENAQYALYDLIASGTCDIFLLDVSSYGRFIDGIIAEEDLTLLPEALRSNRSPTLCDMSSAPFLKETGLDSDEIYGFIFEYNGKSTPMIIDILEGLTSAGIEP